jgi:hypothetical protein
VVVVLGGTAAAQVPTLTPTAEADRLFREGARLMKAGDHARACEAFEESNRVEPRAGTFIRLGHCREQNHQIASAVAAYRAALGRVIDARKRRIANSQLARLGPRVSRLAIHVPEAHRLDGIRVRRDGVLVEPSDWSVRLPVDGGTYRISVDAPDHVPWTSTVVVADEKDDVEIEVPRLEPLPLEPEPRPSVASLRPAVMPASEPAPDVRRAQPLREPSHRRGMSGRRKAAIGFGVVGAGAAGAGLALALQARSLEDEAHDRCPMLRCDDHATANALLERSRSRTVQANIAFGVTGVAVAGAAVLWITGGNRRAVVVPSVAPDHAGAAVVGRF